LPATDARRQAGSGGRRRRQSSGRLAGPRTAMQAGRRPARGAARMRSAPASCTARQATARSGRAQACRRRPGPLTGCIPHQSWRMKRLYAAAAATAAVAGAAGVGCSRAAARINPGALARAGPVACPRRCAP